MSKALEALLAYDKEPTQEVFIKRFGVNFKIKALTNQEYYELREQATYTTGKGNHKKQEVNNSELDALLLSKSVIDPDFSDKKLLDKFNVNDGAGVVGKMLFMGEVQILQEEILKLSGFDDGEEEIEKIKN